MEFKRCIRVILLLALFGLGQNALAGESSPWVARTWLTEHGLPDNNVAGIGQSADGYLWIGTHDGLVCFDGVSFKKVALPQVSGRADLLIRSILVLDNATIWLVAEGGIVLKVSRESTNIFTKVDGLPTFRPMAMARERNGAIWVSYADGSVCELAQGSVKHFDGLPGSGPCWVAADGAGQIWFAKAGRIGVFRGNQTATLISLPESSVRVEGARDGGVWICAGFRLLKFKEGGEPVQVGEIRPGRPGVSVSVLFEDRSGALWAGTSADGLYRFDGTNALRVATSHSEILSITEDREGSLWVGTGGGGLDRLRPRILELQGMESGLPAESIRSVCEDSGGILWATAQNGGLGRCEHGVWKTLSRQDGWPGARATCVTGDGEGGVWIGTAHDGLAHMHNGRFVFLHRRDGLDGEIAHALLQDRDGALWIGWEYPNCMQRLERGGLTTLAQPAGRLPIRTLVQDSAGEIWAGTADGFLFRVSGGSLVDETARTVSPPMPIRCLYAPPDGGLWIGYAGGGIGRLNQGKFARVTTLQGLADDGICSLMADGIGSMWIGSEHGIFQVNEHELEEVASGEASRVRSIVYGRDEMLPNLQAGYGFTPGALRGRDGNIWFPTLTGLAVIHPDCVHANRIPPLTHIEQVLVDGVAWRCDPGTTLRLPPKHRKVQFDVAILSFIAPENVRWKYRLDEVDEDWVEGGASRAAIYPQLGAGTYHFRFIACNSAGFWNDPGVELAFEVAPFYWQTWWFRLGVLLAFTLAVAAVVRYVSFRRLRARLVRLEQETALQRDRARIALDLHDDLGASLTHIALLSELAQNDFEQRPQVKNYVDEIFRTARSVTRSLDEIVWSVSPKNDALDRFVAHLSTYAPEYLRAAGVRARLDLPEELPALELPSEVRHHLYLAVKESLHNIIKHAGATEVWLRLRLTPGWLRVVIEDNGRGFAPGAPAADDADGRANFYQRMNKIGGRCEQQSQPGCGTKMIFTVPLKPAR